MDKPLGLWIPLVDNATSRDYAKSALTLGLCLISPAHGLWINLCKS